MKTHQKLILKCILLMLVLSVAIQSKAQYAPDESIYNPSSSNAAWATGASFTLGTDFTRGFCRAYDDLSPLTNGWTGAIYLYANIPTDNHGGYRTIVIQTLPPLPDTSTWYDKAGGVRDYADRIINEFYPGDLAYAQANNLPLPSQADYVKQQTFYYGYAKFIEWAAQNPGILLLQPGDIM